MKKKLLVFDIDGTLLTSKKELLPTTVRALDYLKKRGHVVLLATGRSRFLINDLLDELQLENYIVCNGSAAFLQNHQVYKNRLNSRKLVSLLNYFKKEKIDVALTSLNGIGRISSNNVDKIEKAMNALGGVLPPFDPNYGQKIDIYQGLAFYDEERDNSFEKEFPEFRFVRWHEYCVDIIPQFGSKAATISRIAKMLKISSDDIIAFGDGNNDIEMIEMAGVGVAMGNANNLVKMSANIITDTNDNDGIVNALEKLRLLE